MIPLERPEVFFLVNNTRSVNVAIEPSNVVITLKKKTTAQFELSYDLIHVLTQKKQTLNKHLSVLL